MLASDWYNPNAGSCWAHCSAQLALTFANMIYNMIYGFAMAYASGLHEQIWLINATQHLFDHGAEVGILVAIWYGEFLFLS